METVLGLYGFPAGNFPEDAALSSARCASSRTAAPAPALPAQHLPPQVPGFSQGGKTDPWQLLATSFIFSAPAGSWMLCPASRGPRSAGSGGLGYWSARRLRAGNLMEINGEQKHDLTFLKHRFLPCFN